MSLQLTTVKVSNVSLGATERDLKEFFSFSGDIAYVEMHRLNLLLRSLSCFVSQLLFLCFSSSNYTVTLSGLKLHMSRSRILKEQRLPFCFR